MRDLAAALLGLAVPPLCPGCRSPVPAGIALCPGCRGALRSVTEPRCERCGAPGGRIPCPDCGGRNFAFDSAWSAVAYDGVARALVGALKYRGATGLAGPMAELIAPGARLVAAPAALVPVPLSRSGRRRRGFNQAELIARELGRRTGLEVADCLHRSAGPAHAGLARDQRLRDAPAIVACRGVPVPASAILVDDVFTTGATLDACARALRGAGARRVDCLTFARTLRWRC